MKPARERHILLCVAGLTPQIIMETLYALTQERGERVDEIRVITTIGGRDRLLKELLAPETGRFYAFCREYGLEPASILFDETTITLLRAPDGRMLTDIRAIEENVWAGNQICEIARHLTRDENSARLHASVAGGRKTMGVYLTAAMQLFGRAQDNLSHVLVNEAFEGHPEFYYIPREPVALTTRDGAVRSTSEARIYLADIPFIRLRGVRSGWLDEGRSYEQEVRRIQDDVQRLEAAREVVFHPAEYKVVAAQRAVKLAPREFFYYLLFADLRRQGRGPEQDGFLGLEELDRQDLARVWSLVARGQGFQQGLEDAAFAPGHEFLEKLTLWVSQPFTEPDFQQSFLEVKAKLKRKLMRKLGNELFLEQYALAGRGTRNEMRYGLPVAPDKIRYKLTPAPEL